MNDKKDAAPLARRLGFAALALYGIGDILGAGIYALVGKVAAEAGSSAWISFLLSGALAAVTGLTYAELVSRVPRSAGAAAFVEECFGRPMLSFLTGLFVLASGVTSAAVVSLAIHGYLSVFLDVPVVPAAAGLIAATGFLAFWGIRESARVNNALTCVEISGLAAVIAAGLWFLARGEGLPPPAPAAEWPAVLSGAALAFYAFVGFEDLANLAEEAKDPARDLPRAILLAVGVTTAIYLAVIGVVLGCLGAGASAETPLLNVLSRAGAPVPAWLFSIVALTAVFNTGLANFIMGSRLVYGMAKQGLLPEGLGRVHPVRRTPWAAVLLTAALCLGLVLTGGVKVLAQTTSLLLTLVFFLLHAGLIRLRRRSPGAPFRAPAFGPWAGLAICGALAARAAPGAWFRAAVLFLLGAGFYALIRRNHPAEV